MNKPFHVYIVDADRGPRDALCSYLEAHGLTVTAMDTAGELLRRMHRTRPDLVVLEMALPGMSGLQACQTLRGEGDRVPVIFLSARDEEVDRVLGLEMGGDDVVGKPFSPRELLARVHAVLRRAIVPPGLPMLAMAPVAIGPLEFDRASRCLRHGERLHVLSTVEYAVLAELVSNPGIAISRERLLAASHSRSEGLMLRAVDVAVMRLRKRIEPDAAQPRFIQTIRGHGYMFVPASAGEAVAPPAQLMPVPQRSRRSTPSGALLSPSMNTV
ncbi:MAG: response regulator [Piscinibacter sp.]|nr:response regulator [Piscinibacter sp.]